MGLSTSKKRLKFDDSKEDLIQMVKELITDRGEFDCRLLSGYGRDCLNKNLPKLLSLTDCNSK